MAPAPEIRLRPAVAADESLLLRIYASTREAELALVPWTDEQKAVFIRFQFDAQRSHYTQHFPDAQHSIVLRGDEPAGRLYVDRRATEHHMIDIAILPEHRGAGIGGALIADLIAEARALHKPLTIYVERENRARQLYERLGFQVIGEEGLYLLMGWDQAKIA